MKKSNDILKGLAHWASTADEATLHGLSVRIELVDNPGWLVAASPTDMLTIGPGTLDVRPGGKGWLEASVRDGELVVAASPDNLAAALGVLLAALPKGGRA